MAEQMRDPQTGRFLTRFEALAKQNALAAQTYGKSEFEANILGLQAAIADESPGVRLYVDQLIELVQEHQKTPAELNKLLPLIAEVVNTATMNDVLLTQREKSRIRAIGKQLADIIHARTRLGRRLFQASMNVVRARVASARDTVSSTLSENPAFLFRVVGRMLARRDRPADSGIMRSIYQARASAYETLAQRQREALSQDNTPSLPHETVAPRLHFDDDDESPLRPSRMHGTGRDGDNGPVLESIYIQLQAIYALLKRQYEQSIRAQEQADRARNDERPNRLFQNTGLKPSSTSGQSNGLLGLFGAAWTKISDVLNKLLQWMPTLPGLLPAVANIGRGVLAAVTGGAAALARAGASAARVIGNGAAWLGRTALSLPARAAGLGGMVVAPVSALASQFAIANDLAGTFNEMMQKYPALKPVGGLGDEIGNVGKTQQSVQQVLEATQQGNVLEAQGGFVSEEEYARRSGGLALRQFQAQNRRGDIELPAPETPAPVSPPPTPTSSPTDTPERLPVKGFADASADYQNAIFEASRLTGIPPIILATFGQIESASGRHVKAKTSSARGPFQFIESTWMSMLQKYGKDYGVDMSQDRKTLLDLRYNNRLAAIMAALLLKENAAALKIDPADPANMDKLYLAHFLGPANARLTLQNKTIRNKQDVLRANPVLGKGTPEEIRQFAERKVASVQLPSAVRSANAMAQASAAARTSVIVVAPQTVIANGSRGAGAPPVIPVPVTTENPDATLRAIQSVNAVG